MRKLMKTFALSAGLSATLVAGFGIATVIGIPAANAGSTGSKADQVKPASSELSALAANGRPSDVLPEKEREFAAENLGESGIDLDTTRFLGKDAAASYWAAEDNSGNVCLLVTLPKGGIASGCTDVENFTQHGVALAYEQTTTREYAEAYLFPDGVTVKSPNTSLRAIGNNLLAGDTRGKSAANRGQEIRAENRPDFVIGLLNHDGEPKH